MGLKDLKTSRLRVYILAAKKNLAAIKTGFAINFKRA
jgi:hypothetical protein